MGTLEMGPVSLTNLNLRDGDGMKISPIAYGQSEVHFFIARHDDMPNQCYEYSKIKLEIYAECEKPDGDGNQEVYQYRTTMAEKDDGAVKKGDLTVVHPSWDMGTSSWANQVDGTPTAARGMETHSATFDVSWKDPAGSSSGGGSASGSDGQDGLNSASGSGLAVGAVLLLFLIAAAFYVYRRREAQKAEQERINCAAAADAHHDSIDVETHATNREDSEIFKRNVAVDVEVDVEKQPLRPDSGGLELRDMSKFTAYPGGQSLPPWPYPEAKPTARPTPASYDPACILKVSWPRDAARPTESALRETFGAIAPVLNVGLGSGNAAMVVFKDPAGARAAEDAYDGPWRVAPAKPPAAAADQPPPPPPPPPKTGEV